MNDSKFKKLAKNAVSDIAKKYHVPVATIILEPIMNNKFIKVNCTQKECPHFAICAQIPTEIVSFNNELKPIKFLFVGQGGGAEEDEQHRPFIGLAGQRLRIIIDTLQTKFIKKRFNFALSNTVRYHPNSNAVPSSRDLKYCFKYLIRDVKFLNPEYLVALGKNVNDTMSYFNIGATLHNFHGTLWESVPSLGCRPMLLTYHPSPRNAGMKITNTIARDIYNTYMGNNAITISEHLVKKYR